MTSTRRTSAATSAATRPATSRGRSLIGSGLLCVSAAAPAWAAPASVANAESRYRQELALCDSGTSNQGRDTCLKEARAAHAEALKAGPEAAAAPALPDPRNASLRCEPLRGDERRDCLARMQGAGTVSGSVGGGGILRETVTKDAPVSTSEPAPASAVGK